jgi:hypothetical protein
MLCGKKGSVNPFLMVELLSPGNWIPTHEEKELLANRRANLERQRAEMARDDADQERQRADLLAAKLRELGIDVD